jgi:tellurite resistance protein TehA-like permease
MNINKLKEDIKYLLEIILATITIIWFLSFFGIPFIAMSMKEYLESGCIPELIFSIIIILFDVILLAFLIYNRYFRKQKK